MSRQPLPLLSVPKPAALLLAALLIATAALAQDKPTSAEPPSTPSDSSSSTQPPVLPNAPQPKSPGTYRISPSASYLAHAGAFCGAGASNSSASIKPMAGCGFGLSFIPLPVFIEFGVMGPQANRSDYSGYLSVDGSVPLASPNVKYLPMAIVGYSRLFETGHALDYGLALATPRFGKDKNDGSSLRFELRDYWTFANPTQHNIMLRIGWMSIAAD